MRHNIVRSMGAAVAVAACLAGCGSPGPYSYARTYVPTDAEERAVEPARELNLVMAQRLPKRWAVRPVSLFGVVTQRLEPHKGWTPLLLSVRRLQRRNLCEDASEQSCRVTVTEHEIGQLRVLVQLHGEDDAGVNAIGPGSLVRVVGKLQYAQASEGETPDVRATYYRHWPPAQYVTTAMRKYMRR